MLAAGSLSAYDSVRAIPCGVRDDAKFFKGDTLLAVRKKTLEIHQAYKKDLLFETYESYWNIEGAETNKAKHKLDDIEYRKLFAERAMERAKGQRVNGIYVLICRDPAHLVVEVGNETRQKAFTLEDRHRLEELMLTRFRAKEYDKGLEEAVDLVQTTLRHNLGTEHTPQPGHTEHTPQPGHTSQPEHQQGGGEFNWVKWLLIGGAVLLGVWLLIGLLRGIGGGMGGMGGGGGFFPSLLGGLFGAAAGMWLYDSFFRGGSHWGSDSTGSSPDPSSTGGDTDYSGEGGDFGGGDDAGGDAGGGDFGGGDFGGGDFGGGGDIGGGDF
jgi:uncharacterized protein